MALPKWMTEMNNNELVADATNAAIAKALQKANSERSEMADIIAGLRSELRKTKSQLLESENRANALDETAGHFQTQLQETENARSIANALLVTQRAMSVEYYQKFKDIRARLSIQENVSDEWRKSANYWRAETVESNLRARHFEALYDDAVKFIMSIIDDDNDCNS